MKGATELALRFNLRYAGEAVKVQTAHKWITGRAIPTNDKLATIAKWLNMDALAALPAAFEEDRINRDVAVEASTRTHCPSCENSSSPAASTLSGRRAGRAVARGAVVF